MPNDERTNGNSALEADLNARARAGDGDARAELCERYRASLVNFCKRYLGNTADAEDVAQDVISGVVLADSWPAGTFRAWLYKSARNRALDCARARRPGRVGKGTVFHSSVLPSPRTGPRTALDRRERDERIRESLASLTTAHAEVLTLHYFSSLTRREIGEVLGVTEAAVRSRLRAAREELARRMGPTDNSGA